MVPPPQSSQSRLVSLMALCFSQETNRLLLQEHKRRRRPQKQRKTNVQIHQSLSRYLHNCLVHRNRRALQEMESRPHKPTVVGSTRACRVVLHGLALVSIRLHRSFSHHSLQILHCPLLDPVS